MILYAASFIIFIFVAFNLFYHAHLPLWAKTAGTLLLLIISLKYEIYQFLGGAFFAPQLPRPMLIFLEAAYGALMLLFFMLLIYDLYLLGNWILGKAGIPIPANLPKGWIKLGIVCLALILGCWGTWQAIKVPNVRKQTLHISSLPASLKGLTIVQLTDLHIGPILKKDWLQQVVEKTNALNPDLILLTGDYADGYASKISNELAPLQNLASRYGVWAVTGNHEYYWDMPAWKKVLDQLGVNMLINKHHALDINGETLVLAGIPDLAAAKFGMEEPDLEKALANAPEAVTILLSHQPRFAGEYAMKADLLLSGHTHGGLMFFLEPLIARFNSGFVKGLYPVHGRNLYVSPGTGLWNGFSCRIGVPAEITLFILDSPPDSINNNA